MSTITKKRAQEIFLGNGPEPTASEERELARIALASLELEHGMIRRFDLDMSNCDSFGQDCGADMVEDLDGEYVLWHEVLPYLYRYDEYTATTATVYVPDAATAIRACIDEFPESVRDIVEECASIAENACRAAMLQGADRPQNEPQNIPENIPATQFKPVADLYGLTSPTGGETSFTFDAVEARDFIDGGWSCQEYVELERFQEAVSGNPPVIPDSWTKCSERMPEKDGKYLVASSFGIVTAWFDPAWSNKFQDCDTNCDEGMEDFEGKVFRVTHWQSLPAAPKQGDE